MPQVARSLDPSVKTIPSLLDAARALSGIGGVAISGAAPGAGAEAAAQEAFDRFVRCIVTFGREGGLTGHQAAEVLATLRSVQERVRIPSGEESVQNAQALALAIAALERHAARAARAQHCSFTQRIAVDPFARLALAAQEVGIRTGVRGIVCLSRPGYPDGAARCAIVSREVSAVLERSSLILSSSRWTRASRTLDKVVHALEFDVIVTFHCIGGAVAPDEILGFIQQALLKE